MKIEKPNGILCKRSGEILNHQDANSIILISSTVASNEVGAPGHVYVDFDVHSREVMINMIGEFLIILETQGGSNLVAQAISHYATLTGKTQKREGEVDVAIIQARKE